MQNIENIGFNIELFRLINGFSHPFFDVVFYLITYLGNGFILIPVILILYRKEKEKILPVISSYLISSIVVQVIKGLWSMPRPLSMLSDVHIIGEHLTAGSFPSGHTATAFALFYVLSHGKSRLFKITLLILAVSVGFSRVYIGVHFPIDVLAGGIIGYISGHLAIKYKNFFSTYKKELVVLFLIPVVLFFLKLDEFPFYIVDEARNAEAAREMLERSDFITPTFNYELRTDKPPLHYWIFILFYKLFGVNEFASRIGSAMIGVVTVLLVYLFTARILNKKTALISALLLPTCLYSFLLFRMAVPDPFLVFFNTAALFSFYLSTSRPAYTYLFYICLGLGTLTKGPVGFLLPYCVALSYTFFQEVIIQYRNENKGVFQLFLSGLNGLRLFFTSRHVIGYIIVALIALPWYIIVSIKTGGDFASGFFLHHNLGRFFLYSIKGPKGIFLITFLFLMLGFFPWSFFITQVFISSYRGKTQSIVLFLSLWVIFYVVFYSISATKLPQYLVPVYPALSILTAKYFSEGMSYKKIPAILIGIVGLSISIGLFVFGNMYASDLMPYIAFIGLPFLIGGIIVLFKDNFTPQVIATSTAIFLVVVAGWFMPKSEKYFIPKKIGSFIEKHAQTSGNEQIDSVYSYKYYDPAFEFYIRKKIFRIDNPLLAPEGSLLISTKKRLEEVTDIRYHTLVKFSDILREKDVLIIQIDK